jgi:TP901 family phage tail tape measure protein
MNIGSLIASIGGDTTPLKAALKQAKIEMDKANKEMAGSVDKLNAKLKITGDLMMNVGKSMTRYLTVPLAAAGGLAIKMASDWQQGMAKINTTAQLSAKELKKLGDEIYSIGIASGTSDMNLLPEAFEKIISQTGDAALSMEIFKSSLDGAKAGFTDISIVSGALAQSLSAIGAGGASANEILDTLFAAKRVGAGEFKDFANYIPQLIASGKALGINYKEVSGAFAYMTGKGNDAASSAMLLQNAFSALGKVDIQRGLKDAGVQVFDVSGKIRGLKDIMGDLGEVMKAMNDEQKTAFLDKIELKDMQAKQAFMVLSSEVTKLGVAMDATANASGEVADALKFAENPSQKMAAALGQLKAVGIELGQMLLPIFTKVITALTSMLKGFRELSPLTKTITMVIAGLAAAIGPLLVAVGFFTSTILPQLISGGYALASAWLPLTAIFIGLAGAMALYNKEAEKSRKLTQNLLNMDDSQFNATMQLVEDFMDSREPDQKKREQRATELRTMLGLPSDWNKSDTRILVDYFEMLAKAQQMRKEALEDQITNDILAQKAASGKSTTTTPTPTMGTRAAGLQSIKPISMASLLVNNNEIQMNPFKSLINGAIFAGKEIKASVNGPLMDMRDIFGDVQTAIIQFGDSINIVAFKNKFKEMAVVVVDLGKELKYLATDVIVSFAESFGNALATGDWSKMGESILISVADWAMKLGGLMIAAGIAASTFWKALMTPGGAPLAIGIGAALVAAGALIKGAMAPPNSTKSAGASKTSSGVSEGSGMDLMGTRRLQQFAIQVTGTIKAQGNELVTVIENETKRKGY